MTMPAEMPPVDPNAPAPAGDPPEPQALGEDGNPLGEPENPQARMVPVGELIKQRTKYRSREEWLKGQIAEKDQQLAKLLPKSQPASAQPPSAKVPDAYTDQLMERLGLKSMFERMQQFEDRLAGIGELEKQFPQVQRATNLAMSNYFTAVQNYAASQHDPKTIPISLEGWLDMVAGGMTPDVVEAIYNGDNQPYLELVARCKKQFKSGAPAPAVPVKGARELVKVHNLPRVPGPGGTPPGEPPEKPLTGRPLHQRAGARFMESIERGKAAGKT